MPKKGERRPGASKKGDAAGSLADEISIKRCVFSGVTRREDTTYDLVKGRRKAVTAGFSVG